VEDHVSSAGGATYSPYRTPSQGPTPGPRDPVGRSGGLSAFSVPLLPKPQYDVLSTESRILRIIVTENIVELSDFYRDLGQLAHVRVQLFDESQPAEGPCVSVGRGDLEKRPPLRLVLNNKTVKRSSGGSYDCVTRLVAEEPLEELFESWPLWQKRPLRPREALQEITFEVEDASPDSTLGVILLLAKLARCDLTQFPEEWVEAAESWEKTGMVAHPTTSWATLSSALAHKSFPVGERPTAENYADAWLDTLRFTSGCLARKAHPLRLQSMEDWGLSLEANALLRQEEQAYHDWLAHAETLQLSLPLRKGGGRRLLIDALLVAEDQATGAAKVFYRNDSRNTPLKGGFTLAAHFRPSERKGDGNDFTIALDYRSGLWLFDLWEELERLECAAWEAAHESRPSDHPRILRGVDNRYDEPWYIDPEQTLVAAPHRLKDGRLGSKLGWKDVCDAIWSIYNPLKDVRLIDRHDVPESRVPIFGLPPVVPLFELQPAKIAAAGKVEKSLWLAAWPHDRNDAVLHSAPRALNVSPTVERILATLAGAAATPPGFQRVALGNLAPPGSWQRVTLSGGFGIITEKGVFILDDWHRELSLNFPWLISEFEKASTLDDALKHLERRVGGVTDELTSEAKRMGSTWHQQGIVQEIARIMFDLAALRGSATGVSSDPDARRVREAMDLQWAVDRRLAAMEQQVQTITTSLRALSDASMWRAAQVFAVGGFTLFLASALAPQGGALIELLAKGHVSATNAPWNPYWSSAFFLITAVVLLAVFALTRNITHSAPGKARTLT
jgi:hypothetical protein